MYCIDNPFLKLFRGGHAFSRQAEPLHGIDHRREHLGAGEFDPGRKLRVFADFIQIVDLVAIEGRDDAMRAPQEALLR